jgi:hypothetical protein
MTDQDSKLLDDVMETLDMLLTSACWYPETDVGTPEMLVLSEYVVKLQQLYDQYCAQD